MELGARDFPWHSCHSQWRTTAQLCQENRVKEEMKNLHNGLKASRDLACSVFSQIWFSHLPPLFPLLQSQRPPHLSLNMRLFCTRDVALAASPAGHALLPMALRIRSCPSLHLCSNVTFSVRLSWHPYLICKIILPASAFPIHSTELYFFPI